MHKRINLLLVCLFSFANQLSAMAAEEPVELFNGRDLEGWTYHLDDDKVRMEDVWSAKDGVLVCKGRPPGYLITKKNDFENYVLTLQWRWTGKAGNNGVLVHVTEPGALGVWPKSLEVQLGHGNAGDFWVIGTTIEVENAGRPHRRPPASEPHRRQRKAARRMERNGNHLPRRRSDRESQRRPGESRTKVSQTHGAIALQSEGTPIEFREIKLQSLEKAN